MKCSCGDEGTYKAFDSRDGSVTYLCDSCRFVDDEGVVYVDMGLIEILKEYDEAMDVVAGYYVRSPINH